MDEKRTAEPPDRRLFLKKAFTTGVAMWTAPAVITSPAGRAWAQTYPPPDGRPHEPDDRGRENQNDGRPRPHEKGPRPREDRRHNVPI